MITITKATTNEASEPIRLIIHSHSFTFTYKRLNSNCNIQFT